MKHLKLTIALLAGLAVIGLTTPAYAANKKDVTITGTALCAKCALHKIDHCQTVVQTTENGKTTTYWLTGKEAKNFHHNICTSQKGEKVTVTGTLKEKGGKEMLHATKIKADK